LTPWNTTRSCWRGRADPAHSEQTNRDGRRWRGSPGPRGGSPTSRRRAGGSPTGTRVGPGHGGRGVRPDGRGHTSPVAPRSSAGRSCSWRGRPGTSGGRIDPRPDGTGLCPFRRTSNATHTASPLEHVFDHRWRDRAVAATVDDLSAKSPDQEQQGIEEHDDVRSMAARPPLADAPLARPTLASRDRGVWPSDQALPFAAQLQAPASVQHHPKRDPRTVDRLTSWRLGPG
jgi:hypothetical protein